MTYWEILMKILAKQRVAYLNSKGNHQPFSTGEIWNYSNNYKRLMRLRSRIENFWKEPL